MDNETENDFDLILEWCAENDLMVSFGAKFTEFDSDNDIVFMQDYDDPNETVYSLLHEIGHFIIQSDAAYVKTYSDKLRPDSPADYFCGFMREERNAWIEGYTLACMLGIEIDPVAFTALSQACLEQYLKGFGVSYGQNEEREITKVVL